jgi:glutamate carboxypeptidase
VIIEDFLGDLKTFIQLEAPSKHPNLVQVAQWIKEQFTPFGSIQTTETPNGPILHLKRSGRGQKVLVLCHFDTVHPVGAFGWKVEGEYAYGPGIYDMKGNIVQLLWALKVVQHWPNLEILFTPDEEIGSLESKETIVQVAQGQDAVLVLEAPMGNGDLKVARKGVGQIKLLAGGRPAHQGVEPEKGINAVVELAHHIPAIVALQDFSQGTTLGPNVIRGGTTSNVVPEAASVDIDVRVWSQAEYERIRVGLEALEPVLPGATLRLEGGMNRPPMEASEASLKLFTLAKHLGTDLGLHLGPGRVGGGSDGNFTAALGIPTLDGLGLYGADAHQHTERVYIPQIATRTALLASLLARLSE